MEAAKRVDVGQLAGELEAAIGRRVPLSVDYTAARGDTPERSVVTAHGDVTEEQLAAVVEAHTPAPTGPDLRALREKAAPARQGRPVTFTAAERDAAIAAFLLSLPDDPLAGG